MSAENTLSRKAKRKMAADKALSDAYTEVSSTAAGRRVLRDILGMTGVLKVSTGELTEGKRRVGINIISRLTVAAGPAVYPTLLLDEANELIALGSKTGQTAEENSDDD